MVRWSRGSTRRGGRAKSSCSPDRSTRTPSTGASAPVLHSGLGKISAEYFSLSAGVDTTPLFKGLEGDLCQCPHWGFVLGGQLTTTDAAGVQETVRANDLFYWPPGHNVKVDADAEIIMFSPQHQHTHVINHMIEKVKS